MRANVDLLYCPSADGMCSHTEKGNCQVQRLQSSGQAQVGVLLLVYLSGDSADAVPL